MSITVTTLSRRQRALFVIASRTAASDTEHSPWPSSRLTERNMMTSSNGNFFRVTGHLCGGIHRSTVNSPHKCQWRGALMFSLICAWINGWVNNREAGDSRRYRAHYEVIPMYHCNHHCTCWWHGSSMTSSGTAVTKVKFYIYIIFHKMTESHTN